jgi:hypothetical protein
LTEFPPDFFPLDYQKVMRLSGEHEASADAATGIYVDNRRLLLNDIASEDDFRIMLHASGVVKKGKSCPTTSTHRHFATKVSSRGAYPDTSIADRRPDAVSLEELHNDICMLMGGLMSTMFASFHPMFWFHLSNLDRIYEQFLAANPAAFPEMVLNMQQTDPSKSLAPNAEKQNGVPKGILGPYYPNSPLPGENIMNKQSLNVRDISNCRELGYHFDRLEPPKRGAKDREPPYYVHFANVDATAVGQHHLMYIYVVDQTVGSWSPPEGFTQSALLQHPGFAAIGTFFFKCRDSGGKVSSQPPVDIFVNISAALKQYRIHPQNAALYVMVGTPGATNAIDLSESNLPVPALRGPAFSAGTHIETGKGIRHGSGDPSRTIAKAQKVVDDHDVKVLQRFLIKQGLKSTNVVDGYFGDETTYAVKRLQTAAGIKATGICNSETKRALLRWGLHDFDGIGGLTKRGPLGEIHDPVMAKKGEQIPLEWSMTWTIDKMSVPAHLPFDVVKSELIDAFDVWSSPAKVKFVYVEKDTMPQMSVSWANRSPFNQSIYNGPGGALVKATVTSITFDSSEKWETRGVSHNLRQLEYFDPWDFFQVKPVAIHAMGHALGLNNSEHPQDAMSPHYNFEKVSLSANDIRRASDLTTACMQESLPANERIRRQRSLMSKGVSEGGAGKRESMYNGFSEFEDNQEATKSKRGSVYDGFADA